MCSIVVVDRFSKICTVNKTRLFVVRVMKFSTARWTKYTIDWAIFRNITSKEIRKVVWNERFHIHVTLNGFCTIWE